MKVLALIAEELTACPDCGTRPDEWDPKQGGHLQGYIPETYTCMGCKAKGDLYDSTTDDMRKLKQSVRGVKVRLLDRMTYLRKAAAKREEKKALYKEYRDAGGRTVSQEAIIAANTPPPVRAPDGPSLSKSRPPKEPAQLD